MPVTRAEKLTSPQSQAVVRVENLSKDFGNFHAIAQVSFEVQKGEILGFLGPNGAGKTTTMRILTGFFPPSSGKIFIEGKDFFKNPNQIKKKIGYLPETVHLYQNMRVREMLEFVASVKNVAGKIRKKHIDEKLSRCGLWDVKHRMIQHLSKGYKQRVGLAQALIGDPDVLVLDEPTTGLDPKQIIEIRALIRELGKERTLILSTHILPEVSMICDRVLIMNKGKVVASGTADELEAGLKKRHEIFISMGDPRRKKEAWDLLESIPGIEQITVVEETAEQVDFSVAASKEQDLRPTISRLFVQHQLPLLELRTGRLSLEEIFMKIVVNENDPGAQL